MYRRDIVYNGAATKAPDDQFLTLLTLLFLGENKLKQLKLHKNKATVRRIEYKGKPDSETLTSTSREPPGLELRIPTRAKRATNRNNLAT